MSMTKRPVILLLVGLLGAAVCAIALVLIGLSDGLPGTEPQYQYPNRHPLRWLALNIGFWGSAFLLLVGLVLLWFQKYDARDDARNQQ